MKIDQLKRLIREDLRRMDKDKTLMRKIISDRQLKNEPVAKSAERSQSARAEGNELFEQAISNTATEYKILHLYNESIAFAPLESMELATAYGNKSALLRRMLKFEYCISEADKALAITESIPLKIKLLCRKAECYTGLHRSSENKKCLEDATALLATLEDSDESKEKLDKMINRAQFFVNNPNEGNLNEGQVPGMIADVVEMQAWKIVQQAEETTSIRNSFKIEYSKQYGHHLVAARDFQPGEIMCVEEPYHNQIIDRNTPRYCCKCALLLWTIVPCDHCSWYVYCSERCKMRAWSDHHSIACHALQHSKEVLPVRETVVPSPDYSPDTLFFRALKEAGSVGQLQTEIESLEKCEDHSNENLVSDENFMSYKTLCLTPIRQYAKKELDPCIRSASLGVIGLAKPVLNTAYDPLNLKKLMRDETALFIGAFLCKLQMISLGKTKSAKLQDAIPNEPGNIPMMRSAVMTAILCPISCVPNIGHCPTSNNKFFMYALEPIKAGSQIFAPKALSSIYNRVPKAQRQFFHQREYQIPCNCRACTNDWDGILAEQFGEQRIPEGAGKTRIWKEVFTELICMRKEIETHPFYQMNLVDEKYITRIREVIVKIWEHFPMPHQLTFGAVKYMIELFEMFFPCNSRR